MQDESNQPHQGTDNQRRGHGRDQQTGIGYRLSPGVSYPETVLVFRMTDGSYLLMGYPQGEPAAFVMREDAELLQQALQGVFGSFTDEAARGNEPSNGTKDDVAPERNH